MRKINLTDRLVGELDKGLRTVFGRPEGTGRATPRAPAPPASSETPSKPTFSEADRVESRRLMRINHTGEVAAQALYQGQALTARLEHVREAMEHAAEEENDHLIWCAERIRELGGHTSVFNPLFYLGSFTIGALAGIAGDRWSLGFVAETERQVCKHLEEHLVKIAENDGRSRAILAQMKIDEEEHGQAAVDAGGEELPAQIQAAMQLMSKVMTNTTYWV